MPTRVVTFCAVGANANTSGSVQRPRGDRLHSDIEGSQMPVGAVLPKFDEKVGRCHLLYIKILLIVFYFNGFIFHSHSFSKIVIQSEGFWGFGVLGFW